MTLRTLRLRQAALLEELAEIDASDRSEGVKLRMRLSVLPALRETEAALAAGVSS